MKNAACILLLPGALILSAAPAKRVTARQTAASRAGTVGLQPPNGTKRPANSQRKKIW